MTNDKSCANDRQQKPPSWIGIWTLLQNVACMACICTALTEVGQCKPGMVAWDAEGSTSKQDMKVLCSNGGCPLWQRLLVRILCSNKGFAAEDVLHSSISSLAITQACSQNYFCLPGCRASLPIVLRHWLHPVLVQTDSDHQMHQNGP